MDVVNRVVLVLFAVQGIFTVSRGLILLMLDNQIQKQTIKHTIRIDLFIGNRIPIDL